MQPSDPTDIVRRPVNAERISTAGRPVLIAWVVILGLTQMPYLKATMDPPQGSVFLGTFHWLDDIQNYLAFAQQAEDGRNVFVNKLYLQTQSPAMVSPEFWLVGRLSAVIGQSPFVAFRLVGVLASLAMIAALDRILRSAGLPQTHRLPALLLVMTGGGLGGVLFLFSDLDISRCLDLSSGMFPFIEALSNPHWTLSTAMLLWALLLFASRARGSLAACIALANLMGLTRPYEPVLLVCIVAFAGRLDSGQRRRLFTLLVGLLPWATYQAWLSLAVPAFSFLARLPYPPFSIVDSLFALGPSALLSLLARNADTGATTALMRRWITLWAFLASLALCVRVPGAQSQLLVGVGLPILALGAVGLARWRPLATWGAVALFSSSALVGVSIVWRGDPHWYIPRQELDVVLALRPLCQTAERAFAPPSLGLLLNALTRCQAHVSHEVAPKSEERRAEVVAFYGPLDPARRTMVLDAACISHVLLPGPSDERPVAWLGPETDFKLTGSAGVLPRKVSIYSRPRPCAPTY